MPAGVVEYLGTWDIPCDSQATSEAAMGALEWRLRGQDGAPDAVPAFVSPLT